MDGIQQRGGFLLVERVCPLGIGKQNVQAGLRVLLALACLGKRTREVCLERLVHHVIDYRARGVKGTRLLAGSGLGFVVVGGQQVLKHFAQQFGVKRDFLIDRRVFDDGEFVGVQDMQKPANLFFLTLLVAISVREVCFMLRAEEEVVGQGWTLVLGA